KGEGVLAVPTDAIISEDGNAYIYIVNSGMVVEKVPVSPGIVDGEWVEIQGEVSAGASVILEGHNKVVDGTKVTVIS
ncbi:efflux RND transporter periplasmic adaptor subunit, partial [candidate division KSB1 bacterium]|nr:efflux RND transporter periplasmic adaptor subunit [candidate division KSB1 bacterium]